MHSSNLFETLATFDKDEFKDLGDIVRSPFFNTNKSLVALYDLIKKYHPDLSNKALIKENAFKKLFPGEEYNDNRMRLLIHRLNSLTEELMIQQNVAENDYWPKIFLLGELKKRRLFKSYEKHLKEAREANYKTNLNTNEFYFVQFTIEQSNLAAQIAKNLDANEKAMVNAQLSVVNESINCFAIITILKFSLFTENLKYRMKIEKSDNLLDEALEHVKNHDYSSHPILMIYYYLNLIFKEPENLDHYINARDIFFKHEDDLHTFDSINIYINLENYLWKLYRRDYTILKGEILKLYNRRIEKNNYKLGGYMPNQIYKRVVRALLMEDSLKKAEKFINERKQELNPLFLESVYNYSCALSSFHKKDYGKALEFLAIAQNEDISHKIDVKNLVLLINYEMNDFDALKLALDSYRHFLKNNQTISEQVKNRAATVIKFLHRLSKLSQKPDEFESVKLKQELVSHNDLEFREWFLDKASLLPK